MGRPIACVVLPTFNEAGSIRTALEGIFSQAPRVPTHELHVLVVDDTSPDGTADIVRELSAGNPHLHLDQGERRGLGEAYKRGIAHAIATLDPDLLFEMDADLQHDPALIPLFVAMTQYGFDLVIGSRFAPGGGTPEFSLWRKFLSLSGNALVRFVGGLPRLHDCTSGYRCIRARLVKECDLSRLATRGYAFQTSFLYELLRHGARPVEIPIVFGPRRHGVSKLSLRDQVEFALNLARLRFRGSREFIAFCVVGASGVIVNLGLYVVLTRQAQVALPLASAVAIESSILSNFVLNELWTFRTRERRGRFVGRMLRFQVVSGLAGLVNYGVFLGATLGFRVWDLLGALIGIGTGVVFNYWLNSLWTWKRADRPDSRRSGMPTRRRA